MDITDSISQQDILTLNQYRNPSNMTTTTTTATEYRWKPKITVKCRHFLYHLTYSEIVNTNDHISDLLNIKNFNILLYIDIPTIDYYLDELNDTKLSKFNKKFKLNKLKHSIWRSFTNNDPHFWYRLIHRHNSNADNTQSSVLNCNLSIKSSGSLRYVETIKFLIESFYDTLSPYKDTIKLNINLNVSRISLKWFSIFLREPILKLIKFNEISDSAKISVNSNAVIDPPFKEYFNKLNEKFSLNKNKTQFSNTLETIVIITNSMGVKALLTILVDKPLTNFIDKRSIDELYIDSLSKSNTGSLSTQVNNNTTPCCDCTNGPCGYSNESPTNFNNNNINNSNKGTEVTVGGALRRESSSLLNFQNTLLTSNKDKSVRIRSLSINRRANKLSEPHSYKVPLKAQIISTHKEPFRTICRPKDILQLIDQEDIHQLEKESTNEIKLNNKKFAKNERLNSDQSITTTTTTTDDDDEDDDLFVSGDEFSEGVDTDEDYSEDEESDENDEGISFFVPSLLSRSGSSTDIHSLGPVSYPKKGRFRSLSLMGPVQRQPFSYDQPLSDVATQSNSSGVNAIPKPKPNSFTNIYIHDGNFYDSYSPKQYKRKYNNIFNPNFVNIHPNNGSTLPINPNLNGLIPPEFYTRLSTPSLSNHNSETSLNSGYSSLDYNINENSLTPASKTSTSQINIFEKNLINKSFELNRNSNRSVENVFDKLIHKKNEERNKHFTLMNFSEHEYIDDPINRNNSNENNGNTLLRELEEEDQMLGAGQEDDMTTDIPQKLPSDTPYKIHGSPPTSSSNLTLFNYDNSHSKTVSPISKQSTLTRLNLSLYNNEDHLSEDKTNEPKDSDCDVLNSKESKPVAFKRIASLNLYGSEDEQNDDYSSNMWVLGSNR